MTSAIPSKRDFRTSHLTRFRDMRKFVKKSRFEPYNSFLFLSTCALALVRFPNYASELLGTITNLLLVILTPLSLFYYLKNKCMSKIFWSIVIFWGLMAIPTLVNSGDLSLFVQAFLSSLLLDITIECGFRTNRHKTLQAFALVWGAIALANCVTMLKYYSPIRSLGGMYRDDGGDANYYLLGQDNGSIFYTIPATIMVVLNGLDKHKKVTIPTILYSLIIGIGYLRVFSGAGIIAYALILTVELLLKNKTILSFAYKRINIRTIFIVLAIVFLIVVLLRSNNFIIDGLSQLLKKDSTFTGRTRIWDIVLEHFSRKPLLGYGIQNKATRLAMIPYGKAHNMVLQLLYNGGIASIVCYITICKNALKDKIKGEFTCEKTFILCTFLIILLVSIFDFYIHHALTFLPMILFGAYASTTETIDQHKGGSVS